MNDVISPKTKQTLLQFMVTQLYDKNQALCNFFEEVPSLEPATNGSVVALFRATFLFCPLIRPPFTAINSINTELSAIKKGLLELKGELAKATSENDLKWSEALGKSDVTVTLELDSLETRMKEYNETVAYFGETCDLPTFLLNWLKFVQLFSVGWCPFCSLVFFTACIAAVPYAFPARKLSRTSRPSRSAKRLPGRRRKRRPRRRKKRLYWRPSSLASRSMVPCAA
jgi:hypothetical protein